MAAAGHAYGMARAALGIINNAVTTANAVGFSPCNCSVTTNTKSQLVMQIQFKTTNKFIVIVTPHSTACSNLAVPLINIKHYILLGNSAAGDLYALHVACLVI